MLLERIHFIRKTFFYSINSSKTVIGFSCELGKVTDKEIFNIYVMMTRQLINRDKYYMYQKASLNRNHLYVNEDFLAKYINVFS